VLSGLAEGFAEGFAEDFGEGFTEGFALVSAEGLALGEAEGSGLMLGDAAFSVTTAAGVTVAVDSEEAVSDAFEPQPALNTRSASISIDISTIWMFFFILIPHFRNINIKLMI
jgi:hypothetical protein